MEMFIYIIDKNNLKIKGRIIVLNVMTKKTVTYIKLSQHEKMMLVHRLRHSGYLGKKLNVWILSEH